MPRSIDLDEDSSVTVDLLAGVADVDGDTLNVTIVIGPAHGTLTQNADGSFTYIPDANWNGTEAIEYAVSDGTVSVPARLIVNVRPINDAPVAHADAAMLPEDGQARIDVLSNDLDIDGDALTTALVQGPQHGMVIRNDDGSFTYTAESDWNGTDRFTYRVSDGALEAIAEVILMVTAVNDAPTAGNQVSATAEDTPITGDLLAGAADIDSVILAASIVTGPSHGQLSLNADGSFQYVPQADWNGSDSFTYRVNDGELDSALATVTMTIAPVNDAPIVPTLTTVTGEDTAIALDLLAGATDIDGDTLTAAIVTGPVHGQVSVNSNGSFTYVPDANWNGTASYPGLCRPSASPSSPPPASAAGLLRWRRHADPRRGSPGGSSTNRPAGTDCAFTAARDGRP